MLAQLAARLRARQTGAGGGEGEGEDEGGPIFIDATWLVGLKRLPLRFSCILTSFVAYVKRCLGPKNEYQCIGVVRKSMSW